MKVALAGFAVVVEDTASDDIVVTPFRTRRSAIVWATKNIANGARWWVARAVEKQP